jgi:hypothetical protein
MLKTIIFYNMKILKITLFVVLILSISCHTTSKNQAKTLQQIPEYFLGTFKDDYGSVYRISKKEWTQGNAIKYHLVLYSEKGNYFIAKNDDANPSDRSLYSRIDVLYFQNMEPWYWGYCLTAYKAASIQEAINTAAADRVNPRKGCNGYPFSRMKRE